MQRIYFDYAATTPIDARVKKEMNKVPFGNPSSLHAFGQEAQKALDGARATMARLLGADFRDILFTGSATEANNLVLRGMAEYARRKGQKRPKIIISAVEHESVFETAHNLERHGMIELVVVPVDNNGIVAIKKIEKELNERTILVSVMYVNNEIGSVQPISKISEMVSKFRMRNAKPENGYPFFHTDAVQAFQYFECDVNGLGVDFLTLSAHKLYGPKGVGVLYVRNSEHAPLEPIITGGGQEFGLRSGTQNVPGIVGCAEAAALLGNTRGDNFKKTNGIKKEILSSIKEIYPRAEVNGEFENESPHILNVWFPGIPNELLLIQLDQEGIAVSAGSACHARAPEPSRTIAGMYGESRAKESIRFSFGNGTKNSDIHKFETALKNIISRYKS